MVSIVDLVTQLALETAPSPRGGVVVRVPTAHRGALAVHAVERERTVTLRVFVLRGPDRGHADVYRRLLVKNLDGGVWRLALDAAGDIVAAADLDRGGLDAERLDGVLGALSVLVDEIYGGVLAVGFDAEGGAASTSVLPKQRANL